MQGGRGRIELPDLAMLTEKRTSRECAYRVARPRGLPDAPATAKNAECSTHPERPRALIRRHSPRVSPNCTRVFGPIDATTREARLASARTSTQCLEMELTQRELDLRALEDGGEASLVDDFARGLDFGAARVGAGRTAVGETAGSGADWTIARSCSGGGCTAGTGGLTLSRAMLPELAIVVRLVVVGRTPSAEDGDAVAESAGASAKREAAVSTFDAGVSAPRDAGAPSSALIFFPLSRRTNAVITMAANATPPTAFQM